MKKVFALMLAAVIPLMLAACGEAPQTDASQNQPGEPSSALQPDPAPQALSEPKPAPPPTSEASAKEGENTAAMPDISIAVGNTVFSAKLHDNDTTRALLEQLPMTLNLSELNGNEKYCYLPDDLPTDSRRVGNIENGDLMLYGSDCLVLFYESFSTSYSYTRLGFVEDASGLAAALGNGGVEATFAVVK